MKSIFLSVAVIGALVVAGIGGTFADWVEDDHGGYCFTNGFVNLVVDVNGVWDDVDDIGEIICETGLEPGDSGEVTLSFHAYGDPASGHYATVSINGTCDSFELGCVEPEETEGDATCGSGSDQGELQDYLVMFIWEDMYDSGDNVTPPGDNVWQEEEERVIFCGTFADLIGGSTTFDVDICEEYYVGVAWEIANYGESYCGNGCAITPSLNREVNKSMTDKLSGTVYFTVTGPFPKS